MATEIPQNDREFIAMLTNFAAKLPDYAEHLGLSTEEVASVQADVQYMRAVEQAAHSAHIYSKAWTAMRNVARKGKSGDMSVLPTAMDMSNWPTTVAPGIERRIRLIIRRIKSSLNYTGSIGKNLGIEVTKEAPKLNAPKVALTFSGTQPILNYRKGKAHGVRIFSRRGNETDFQFLDIDTKSPYVDKRPNLQPGVPEQRQYYAVYFIDDESVGQQSSIVSIIL